MTAKKARNTNKHDNRKQLIALITAIVVMCTALIGFLTSISKPMSGEEATSYNVVVFIQLKVDDNTHEQQ